MKVILNFRLCATAAICLAAFSWPAHAAALTQQEAGNRCNQFQGDLHYTETTCEQLKQNPADRHFVPECLSGVAVIRSLMGKSHCVDTSTAAAH